MSESDDSDDSGAFAGASYDTDSSSSSVRLLFDYQPSLLLLLLLLLLPLHYLVLIHRHNLQNPSKLRTIHRLFFSIPFSDSQSLLDVSGPGSDSSHPSSKRYSMRHNRPVRFPVSLFPRNSIHSSSRTRRLAIRHAKPHDGVMDSVPSLLQAFTITPTAKARATPAFLLPLLLLRRCLLLLLLLRMNPHSLTPKNADAKNSSI